MGTKNNPGKYDCYANAEPDEPLFVLRADDTTAPLLVTLWVALKTMMVKNGASKISPEKLDEARKCSVMMAQWAMARGKSFDQAAVALASLLNTDNAEDVLVWHEEARKEFANKPMPLDDGDVAVPVAWPVGKDD